MSDEVTRWLTRATLPLTGLAAGAPTTDLQPLKDVLDGVRVVGLGEATHGTREFFRLKHRLLEFLVTELGFSVLAMEASASAGPAVDAYVRHGIGDAARVVAGLGFWTWRTHEVLAVVEWLRGYNRGRREDRMVRFVGIDPQWCGSSLALVGSFLRETAPDRAAGLLSPLRALGTAGPGSLPDPRRRLVHDAEQLSEFLRRNAPDATDVLRHARILVRAADLVTCARRHTDPGRTVFAVRDRHMADAVEAVLDDPSMRVALWAHNGHIAKRRHGGAAPSLGQHLRSRYGDAYYALGLLFGRGAFRARRMRSGPWARSRAGVVATHRVGPPRAGSVEARLAAARPGDHLVDLRGASDAPAAVREWLDGSGFSRSFGAVVPRWTYRLRRRPLSPAVDFDGLVHIAESSASRPFSL
ncbi:erythromycin esterase [Streptomyces sp. PanSC19]|uniref:erythromycin esterase family protein n=1 Tax=Streptomyces sp. PanSC19 TaxID=1520455 RepID=UPI000F46D904|nr:erythromycin esterase family protein [Streptomyces sp. PanSC19]ROQ26398.1 erythromycin esterase [Streptomyces sp. PanSC19]